jgi:Asp/Glu/Hydantoin racemase
MVGPELGEYPGYRSSLLGTDMKTIGIVGGIAWPLVYYRIINELVAQRLGDGGLHSASLVLAQTDFELIERNQREGRWDLVGDVLAEQGNKLKAAGADFFLLACNTVHTTADRIQSAVDLPFLHIVDPTAREVQQRGVTTVGLLGSRYTMTGSYFVGRLHEHYGTNVLVAERQTPGERAQPPSTESLPRTCFCRQRVRSSRLRSRILSGAARRPSSSDAPSSACSSKPRTARCS